MKYLILLLAMSLTVGCSMRDIVSMDGQTKQAFDLNDNDNDGVIMARERCVETVMGASIDNYGCPTVSDINERQELQILFENDSDYINPRYYQQIEQVAKLMKMYPNTLVTIEGHCSRTGSYEHNLALSQARADNVVKVLSDTFGIASVRLTATGFSYDQPIDLSETPEANEANRRVMAEVTGDDTKTDMKWHIYTVDQ
ncbi:OmpA family protein [Shewanella olleyana]|uniref:OmpA family protein n=1 Tax=Shewanella olleyana TaxID=135626 RepID=UPI00200C0E16|nr:OmpA family protein [Shewanella olleyana]MCL1068945.1 OmpA family protein [Shewanella olleyana]